MSQGVCTVRSLRNISHVEREIKEPVVANNATASTVAFIAPGPPNPPITQVQFRDLLETGGTRPVSVNECGRYLLSSSLMFQVLHSLSPAQLFVKLLKDFETIPHSEPAGLAPAGSPIP